MLLGTAGEKKSLLLDTSSPKAKALEKFCCVKLKVSFSPRNVFSCCSRNEFSFTTKEEKKVSNILESKKKFNHFPSTMSGKMKSSSSG